jgi:hypothetical protein
MESQSRSFHLHHGDSGVSRLHHLGSHKEFGHACLQLQIPSGTSTNVKLVIYSSIGRYLGFCSVRDYQSVGIPSMFWRTISIDCGPF